MKNITHGSLFSGIGGFDLAARNCGIETLWQIEIDEYCLKVLNKNFPNAKRYGDIKGVEGRKLKRVDIISGGFPCQPFSIAGKRKGTEDDRNLWGEMHRVVSEVKPVWVIAENVYGIINIEGGMVFEKVLSDLEGEGYEVQTFLIAAAGVDAWHKRERVWVVAYSGSIESDGLSGIRRKEVFKVRGIGKEIIKDSGCRNEQRTQDKEEFGDAIRKGITVKCFSEWEPEPGVDRMVNGIPNRVDRLRGLGNAIVPQVADRIFKTILEVEEDYQ